jgi:predicted type IV restriction endonuclease
MAADKVSKYPWKRVDKSANACMMNGAKKGIVTNGTWYT